MKKAHCIPVDRVDAQLYPDGISTSTPQTFLVATTPVHNSRRGVVPLTTRETITAIPAHIHQVGAG